MVPIQWIFISLSIGSMRATKTEHKSKQEERVFCVCLSQSQLTCWLNVDAAGGSLHETRGHVVIRILLWEPGVLVTHQPVLKLEMVLLSRWLYYHTNGLVQHLKFRPNPGYKINGTIELRLNNTVIYNINFEDNKRLPFLPGLGKPEPISAQQNNQQ